jgi:hypothetical protein
MQISQGQRTQTKESEAVRPGGTPPADEGIASSGITFRLWRLYQRFWLCACSSLSSRSYVNRLRAGIWPWDCSACSFLPPTTPGSPGRIL